MKIYKWVPISTLDQVNRSYEACIKVRNKNQYSFA